ncbi:YwaF family protein [Neobacillus thermocopriae]|uniref:TIGR02206 family membrane protein n=2 Tax=Neobacillus thermocopriae TaxID=1215031 RepID=A0A6B3TPQ2_9BACI|nr:TIGR02206 family membrane protein [Neobacillus thermocopriae]MED3624178.1 TIGR02206 family membrane protein [Neobacillus thermocopriae]NEX77737.1 TIGR02206 family membrane protein [Neobacillus thermocopriae]
MDWFGSNYQMNPFKMFSISHIVVISILIFVSMMIFWKKERLKDDKWRRYEIAAAISLLGIEALYHLWMFVGGMWKVSHSLPLELCSISLFLTVLLLITKKKLIYEILLFTALLGASQALITPYLNFDFPHFRFFHFFYTHLMMIWVVLYFTWVKGYRPTLWSIVKLCVFLNGLLPVILLINKRVSGNYFFLSHKPPGPSLLDLLGPYPYYILSMEALLIVLSIVIWFIFRDKSDKRTTPKNDPYLKKPYFQ